MQNVRCLTMQLVAYSSTSKKREPANLLGADSGDLIDPKFCTSRFVQIHFKERGGKSPNTFQIKRWKEHCAPGEEEKAKRVQWRTHAGVMQPCEHAA